jgi:hypothetical protein
VVVIIDEYDAPMLSYLDDDVRLAKVRQIMQEFYQTIKDCDAEEHFVFITGITKFSQLSIFSTINNLTNITMDDRYASLCGITEKELYSVLDDDVEMLADKMNVTKQEMYAELKHMYDGYHFCEDSEDIYNPYSLMRCFYHRRLQSYWYASGTPTFLLNEIKKRFSDEVFLSNKGLSNEVGIHVFCYDPKDEMIVRSCFYDMVNAEGQPFRLIECDLYKIFLQICEEKRILKSISNMEKKKGSEGLLKQLQKAVSPEAFVEKMKYEPHRHGDILLITGVGKVYPFMRSHNILDNIQHIFSDIPVVMLYPGAYDGQTLSLFDEFNDGNYYRAFNMI